jgi:hypothetical protein
LECWLHSSGSWYLSRPRRCRISGGVLADGDAAGRLNDDNDGEPDAALFGAAESPMIYTIDDGDPDARAQELVAASERIAELESDVSALEQNRSPES